MWQRHPDHIWTSFRRIKHQKNWSITHQLYIQIFIFSLWSLRFFHVFFYPIKGIWNNKEKPVFVKAFMQQQPQRHLKAAQNQFWPCIAWKQLRQTPYAHTYTIQYRYYMQHCSTQKKRKEKKERWRRKWTELNTRTWMKRLNRWIDSTKNCANRSDL